MLLFIIFFGGGGWVVGGGGDGWGNKVYYWQCESGEFSPHNLMRLPTVVRQFAF